MSASNGRRDETPRLFTSSGSTTTTKRSILRKKLQADKLALELKIVKGLVSKETVVLRRGGTETRKFALSTELINVN